MPNQELPDVYEALEAALDVLEKKRPRSWNWVMLRFYTGLKEREIAEIYDVSERTVIRDWIVARHFLSLEVTKHLS